MVMGFDIDFFGIPIDVEYADMGRGQELHQKTRFAERFYDKFRAFLQVKQGVANQHSRNFEKSVHASVLRNGAQASMAQFQDVFKTKGLGFLLRRSIVVQFFQCEYRSWHVFIPLLFLRCSVIMRDRYKRPIITYIFYLQNDDDDATI
mgnify:CR=1 FL=1